MLTLARWPSFLAMFRAVMVPEKSIAGDRTWSGCVTGARCPMAGSSR